MKKKQITPAIERITWFRNWNDFNNKAIQQWKRVHQGMRMSPGFSNAF